MIHRDGFWRLEHLSDAQLLESLGKVLATQQRALAEIVAHLGEVEDRRLHLKTAHSSLFAYCLAQLGMSEDEACRRIELARLARRFPALFSELASGQITLSVALVLKPVLSPGNHVELLSAARGKSIRQARELVAERFPRPDAPSSVRKLPERRPPFQTAAAGSHLPAPADGPLLRAPEAATLVAPAATSCLSTTAAPIAAALLAAPLPSAGLSSAEQSVASPPSAAAPVAAPPSAASLGTAAPTQPSAPFALAAPSLGGGFAAVARNIVEPLSAGRYRIQFTADTALKLQLERARDLLRHTYPSGDFAPIVSRALELLIDDLMRRRFGARARRKVPTATPAKAACPPSPAPAKAGPSRAPDPPEVSELPLAAAAPSNPSYIPRPARRAVLERDELSCNWVAPNGARCGSPAWLEFDHCQPAGKGGDAEPDNLRLLCRAHNQFAAEQAYGREHVERATRLRQRRQQRRAQPASPPA